MSFKLLPALIFFFAYTSRTSSSVVIEKDFSAIFGKLTGTIVIYNQNTDTICIHNKTRAETRLTPFSTFKIPNSIIALETGIITDVDQIYQWDTTRYPPEPWWFQQWNQKHSMRSAIKYSVVPFYRNIAFEVGAEKMKTYVRKFQYGNADISSGVDAFWLSGSLRISAMEQIEFLKKFYNNNLGISEKTTHAVKSILVQEKTDTHIISGKTGGGNPDNDTTRVLGWLVGYVEKGNEVVFFALNIDGKSFSDIMSSRMEITKAVLKKIHVID